MNVFAAAALLTASASAATLAVEPSGPDDIVIEYESDASTAELWDADRDMLVRYAASAETIIVGQVVATRPDADLFGVGHIATVLIEERLCGDVVGLVELRVPLVVGDGRARPALIEGYRLLLFLDETENVVDGAAIFFVEGGHAWRNRREGVFLRPSVDRAWGNEMDPLADYISLSLDEVRAVSGEEAEVRRGWRRRG